MTFLYWFIGSTIVLTAANKLWMRLFGVDPT